MRVTRHIATLTVATLVAALGATVVTASPARADSPGVGALVHTLTDPTNSLQAWTKGLGTVGKLADALPAVQTSPGAALEFEDLLAQAFTQSGLAGATTDDGLNVDKPITISDSRTGTVKSTLTAQGSDKKLHLTVDISRTLADQPLSIALPIGAGSSAPQSRFSSTGGVQLTAHTALTFDLVWDHASDTAYIVAGGGTPAITVDATASFANKAAVKAAVGILGVSLADDSTLDLSAHLVGSVNDPNNDGRLAFANNGELAQNGSLAGLVSFGFAHPAGALSASLHLGAASDPSSSVPFALPAVNTTIGVQWPDISTGTPTITTPGLDTVGKFLNLTPRDLADGLGQLVTSLTSIQHAQGNVNLPFLKGTLADAVAINEAIKKFLQDNTYCTTADPNAPSDANCPANRKDPAKVGFPTFVSLQQLLDRLNAVTSPATIGISNVSYDDASSKLAFKVTVARTAPATPVDLNVQAAAASGGQGSTYTHNTLVDSAQHWSTDEWVGRRVVAGTSGGTVLHNDATSLTLEQDWTPTVPVANAPYTISGPQGDVGTVSLGNALQAGGKGVANANAVAATAKVTPSYRASITLVLDLRNPTVQDPPIEQHNADGSTTIVSALPLATDRVMVRTGGSDPLFTADFPIDADVDLFANAGFLQVELKGSAHVCQTNAGPACTGTPGADDHMLQVDLKDQGDLTFGQIVDKVLHDPGSLLDFHVHVRGSGNLAASIPGLPDFLGSATANASFHWDDVTQGAPQFDLSDLSELANVDFDPSNPKQLFSIILKTLQTLDSALGDASPPGFDTKIPVLGRSLRDLLRADESGAGPQVTYGANTIHDASRTGANAFPPSLKGRTVVAGTQVGVIAGVTADTLTLSANWANQPSTATPYVVRSELDDVISLLQAAPSDNLQALVKVLDDRLAGTPLNVEYKEIANQPSLVVHLDWTRNFHTSAPVQFGFHLPIGDQSLAGVQGNGSVSIGAGGEIKIGLVVPLAPGDGPADAGALKILNDSHIGVKANATVDDASLATTIGPLSISLGNPKSTAPADKAQAKASYSVDLAKAGADGSAESFSDFLSQVSPTLNATSASGSDGFHSTALR